MERLDKILSDSGIGTRKNIKKMISDGRVFVNGSAVTKPETKIDRDRDTVAVDGKITNTAQYRYFAMNKPAGVLSATEDLKQSTVLDLLKQQHKGLNLFPVGRLDKDTTGLLLLTNDGDFAHKVISPQMEIDKKYLAVVDGSLTDDDVNQFAEGLILKDGTRCQNAGLEIISPNCCYVTIHEGKYHQVKRMLASVGKPVLSLRRLSIGSYTINDAIEPGEYVELSKDDLCKILIGNSAKNSQ